MDGLYDGRIEFLFAELHKHTRTDLHVFLHILRDGIREGGVEGKR